MRARGGKLQKPAGKGSERKNQAMQSARCEGQQATPMVSKKGAVHGNDVQCDSGGLELAAGGVEGGELDGGQAVDGVQQGGGVADDGGQSARCEEELRLGAGAQLGANMAGIGDETDGMAGVELVAGEGAGEVSEDEAIMHAEGVQQVHNVMRKGEVAGHELGTEGQYPAAGRSDLGDKGAGGEDAKAVGVLVDRETVPSSWEPCLNAGQLGVSAGFGAGQEAEMQADGEYVHIDTQHELMQGGVDGAADGCVGWMDPMWLEAAGGSSNGCSSNARRGVLQPGRGSQAAVAEQGEDSGLHGGLHGVGEEMECGAVAEQGLRSSGAEVGEDGLAHNRAGVRQVVDARGRRPPDLVAGRTALQPVHQDGGVGARTGGGRQRFTWL